MHNPKKNLRIVSRPVRTLVLTLAMTAPSSWAQNPTPVVVRWDSTTSPQLPAEGNNFLINFVTGKFLSVDVAPQPFTTGPGSAAISVPPAGIPLSATCNYLNSGGSGIFTLGPRAADQGVAPVTFGQTIDRTLPYQSQIFTQASADTSSAPYFAVKFYLSPDATTPNYGWIEGGGCNILDTNV